MIPSLSLTDSGTGPRERIGVSFAGVSGRMFAVLAFVAVLPLALLLVGLVLIDLGRPVFFAQTRQGLGTRCFTIWKFRTMRNATGADNRPLADHLRVTPLMRVVRRLRMDEIPQLFSILKGEMAFVGPRPLLPATVYAFGDAGAARCTVRPGLTGWAQVNGNTRLTDRQKLALDLWYVDHRSALLDARILLLTAVTILLGERVRPLHLDPALAALDQREKQISEGATS